MNSKMLKIALEGLGCLFIALGLSYAPIVLKDFPLDLALLPLIWFALRRGMLPALIFSLGYGLVYGLLHGNGDLLFVLVDGLAAYGVICLAGLFARNTVRTAFNQRLSSTLLNIVTATVCVHALTFLLHGLSSSTTGHSYYTSGVTDFSQFLGQFHLQALVNLACQLVILGGALYIHKKLFIPKNTRFISRREQSHLLND